MKLDTRTLCYMVIRSMISNQVNLDPLKIICTKGIHLIMWLNRVAEVCWHSNLFAILKRFCGLKAFPNSGVKHYITIQEIIFLNNAVY